MVWITRPQHHAAVDDRLRLGTRLLLHDIRVAFFHGQGQGGRAIGDQVEPEQLDGGQGSGQACQRGQEDDHDLGHIGGQQEEHELADVGVNDAALFHRRDDAGIVVVGEHHVGGFLGDIRAGDAHGHADVGALDGGRVVDAVAGHRDDFIVGLQGIHDAHLVLGRDAGKDSRILDHVLEFLIAESESSWAPVITFLPWRSRPMVSAMARAVLG